MNDKIKLNKVEEQNDFEMIPDIPNANHGNEGKEFVKLQDEAPGRKLFSNKKANIALISISLFFVIVFVAALIIGK